LSQTLYLDTSAVVSLLATEPESARLESWLQAQEASVLAISAWVNTEVASALSMKVRMGQFTLEQRADAAAQWRLWSESVVLLPIEQADFEAAAGSAARHALGLRAGDALHLAVAASAGCTLVTLDEGQANAAVELGVPVAEI
jgi:predicted nucleic acid-binding protein